MELPTFFTDFDGRITPTAQQRTAAREGHKTLRELVENDPELKSIVDLTFLQGSYRRSTAVRPTGDSRLDVDVIVVTNIDPELTRPARAIQMFVPFVERNYPGRYRLQGRSIGISLDDVDLDLVVTAKPDEATREAIHKSAALGTDGLESPEWSRRLLETLGEWQGGSLLIPDREADEWSRTHPLAQIQWTASKNASCGGNFLRVVRAAKWRNLWAREGRAPKSFPLERLVGEYCPDGITSVGAGAVGFYENALLALKPHADSGTVPFLPDYGAPEHNVLGRCTHDDICDLVSDLEVAAQLARSAFDATDRDTSAQLWRRLLGDDFPEPEGGGTSGRFTERAAVSTVATARFA